MIHDTGGATRDTLFSGTCIKHVYHASCIMYHVACSVYQTEGRNQCITCIKDRWALRAATSTISTDLFLINQPIYFIEPKQGV